MRGGGEGRAVLGPAGWGVHIPVEVEAGRVQGWASIYTILQGPRKHQGQATADLLVGWYGEYIRQDLQTSHRAVTKTP